MNDQESPTGGSVQSHDGAGAGLLEAIRKRHRERAWSGVDEPDAPSEAASWQGSPWRGIALGLIGDFALSIIIPYADAYLQASRLSATYLPTGVFLALLLILGLNTLLLYTRAPLTQQEIMLAYVTMLVPSMIPSEGLSLRVVPLIAEIYYYATPVNEWAIIHIPNIPVWMTPHGKDVINWFFAGMPAGASIPWRPWVEPLAMWALLAASLYMIMYGLTVALRKRWMDAERLQFPLAQVPLMILGDDPAPSWRSKLFHSPLMWYGMAIPFVFHTINGLHVYFPVVPSLPLTGLSFGALFSGSRFFTDPPFNALSGVTVNFYWSVIGISYLLRSEVLLSVWVFEWFYSIEKVIFFITGLNDGQYEWTPLHTFGYTLAARYQRVGAMVFITIIYLVASRGEIREMFRAAIGRASGQGRGGRRDESIPWWSAWSLVGGLVIFFAWTYATGMSFIVSFLLLFFFLVISVTAARIVAATGLLWVNDYMGPLQGVYPLTGTVRISPHTYTNLGYVDQGVLSNQMNIMPPLLDGMKITRQVGIRPRHYFLGTILGIVLAVIVSFAMVLWLGYTFGGQNLDPWSFHNGGNWVFNRVADFQRYHTYTNWTIVGLMAAGAAFMGGLMYLYRTYLWWPLYPLGFVIGGTVASGQIWFPVFVGWLLKRLVLRFGGAHTYHRFKDFALGLVIGEFLCVGLWLAIDAATGTTMHLVFPDWIPN